MQSDSSCFYIGWDVGGWNCEKNSKSRDAILILDRDLSIVGNPWRGNLRRTINDATNSEEWLDALFTLCDTELHSKGADITLAIDTPLDFSEDFIHLVADLKYVELIGQSGRNPYLFRQTEQFLFNHGLTPLSAIKDMLGSQATKGMHVLAKFSPNVVQCGVWSDEVQLSIIEAYPSACESSASIQKLLEQFIYGDMSFDAKWRIKDIGFHSNLEQLLYLANNLSDNNQHLPEEYTVKLSWVQEISHPDIRDALICALLANIFANQPNMLVTPAETIPVKEGWIWVPKDSLQSNAKRPIVSN